MSFKTRVKILEQTINPEEKEPEVIVIQEMGGAVDALFETPEQRQECISDLKDELLEQNETLRLLPSLMITLTENVARNWLEKNTEGEPQKQEQPQEQPQEPEPEVESSPVKEEVKPEVSNPPKEKEKPVEEFHGPSPLNPRQFPKVL